MARLKDGLSCRGNVGRLLLSTRGRGACTSCRASPTGLLLSKDLVLGAPNMHEFGLAQHVRRKSLDTNLELLVINLQNRPQACPPARREEIECEAVDHRRSGSRWVLYTHVRCC